MSIREGHDVSETLWWFLQPSGWTLLALLGAWASLAAGGRGLARGLVGLILIPWAAVVLLPLDAWSAAPLEARHPFPDPLPNEVDGVLVLGGSVDWRASTELSQLALGASGERMLAAAAAARRWPEATLAFTGVIAEALASDFRADPVPTSLIFGPEFERRQLVVLPGAASTYDDALRALDRLRPGPNETWILITSAWHMPRAWATFRTAGWTTVPYPVDPMSAGATIGFSPSTSPAQRLADLDRVVREWGAIWIYR
ncbi:MAG: YdcF family protein, partial [Trueperaceae bacterium]